MRNSFWMPTSRFRRADVMQMELSAQEGALAGKKLLFVSDIHMCRYFTEEKMALLTAQMAAWKPDMLLLGGDYGESAQWIYRVMEWMAEIQAPLGRFGVMGNNDRYFLKGQIPQFLRRTEELGIQILINQTYHLSHASVAGLDEMLAGKPEYKEYFQPGDGVVRILLSHYPQAALRALAAMRVKPHLILAGHTHGGQIRLGKLTPYSVGYEARLGPPPCVWGEFQTEGAKMLVSNGVGTSGIPLRIFARPQIHLIQLL